MAVSPRSLARLAGRCLGEVAVHLFPARCFSCERSLPRIHLLGACLTCWASLSHGPNVRCGRCGLPLPDRSPGDGPAHDCCARCAIRPLPFERAVAAVDYDATARRFLLRAKDGKRPELFGPLAGQLAVAVAVSGLADGIDGIVPVPSSARARWRRGFNPSRLLARELARVAGLPLLDGVLRQRGLGGAPAKALGATARWAGAESRIVAKRDVPGARILLVDDVLTTGATASACATALRAAGALQVSVAIWARTPSPAGFDRSPTRRL